MNNSENRDTQHPPRQRLGEARERREHLRGRRRRTHLLDDHLGSVITAIVSLAAIFISLTQVWVATNAKANELKLQQMQQEQEWKYKALDFVTRNADSFFGKDAPRREHMANALAVVFPPEVAGQLLSNLKQTATSKEARKTFADTEERMHTMKPK